MEVPQVCSIDGCDRASYARGWCNPHWQRWKRSGDPGLAEIQKHLKSHTCSVPDCDNQSHARDICAAHYRQWAKLQDHKPCSTEGCDRPLKAKGLCNSHYERERLGRTMSLPIGELIGENSNRWAGEKITYYGLHVRIKRVKGKASEHLCSHCGKRATQWAYDHLDPEEKINLDHHLAYSLDPDRYIPLCSSCHKIFDLSIRPRGATPRSK